jgi:hypothetical protein
VKVKKLRNAATDTAHMNSSNIEHNKIEFEMPTSLARKKRPIYWPMLPGRYFPNWETKKIVCDDLNEIFTLLSKSKRCQIYATIFVLRRIKITEIKKAIAVEALSINGGKLLKFLNKKNEK